MYVFIRPGQRFLSCLVCQGLMFERRSIKMVTTGMAVLDLEWMNQSSDGAICSRCGFVHSFMGSGHQWIEPSLVKDGDLPVDPLA